MNQAFGLKVPGAATGHKFASLRRRKMWVMTRAKAAVLMRGLAQRVKERGHSRPPSHLLILILILILILLADFTGKNAIKIKIKSKSKIPMGTPI
jgi:hypothetical protein